MKVEILTYTKNGEMTIAQAGKLCYSPVGVGEIKENTSEEEAGEFVDKLSNLGHLSPIEHVSVTFAVEGVSRTLSHQLVRHRIASYSQQSQRYVKLDQFEYIIPPSIEKNPRAKKIFIQAMEDDQRAYDEICDELYKENYEKFIDHGMSEEKAASQAEKASIEDARYVFPNACETKMVFTMNARQLLHVIRLRTCMRAQWEIREMATEMLRLVKEIYPSIFKDAGPGCMYGPCPEGKMTCGKINQVREYFKNL